MDNKFDRLNLVIENNTVTQNKWREVFANIDSYSTEEKEKMLRWGAGIIWHFYESFSLEAFFGLKNIKLAKQHFYTCGMLDVYLIDTFDADILDWGLNHFSYALLSDNLNLINGYADLKHSNFEKNINRGASTATYVLQCLIKDDWAEYERAMAIMKTKTLKKYPVMQWDIDFFEGMAERNKTKIEAVLAGFVTPKVHKQRNRLHILLNEFISHPALGYAKLAWLKGIEVEVNSPLVPKELLPVQPLSNYINEYKFLDDVLTS